jgi:hypothetical protein
VYSTQVLLSDLSTIVPKNALAMLCYAVLVCILLRSKSRACINILMQLMDLWKVASHVHTVRCLSSYKLTNMDVAN